jgi:hypothetical protein
LNPAVPIAFRQAEEIDIAGMAAIRAEEWETQAFWEDRIRRYLTGDHRLSRLCPLVRRSLPSIRESSWDLPPGI